MESPKAGSLERQPPAASNETNDAVTSTPARDVPVAVEQELQPQSNVENQETLSLKCCMRGCMFSLDEAERHKQGFKGTVQRWYKFPVNNPRWKEWLKSMKMDTSALSNIYICNLHFSEQEVAAASQVAKTQTEPQVAKDSQVAKTPTKDGQVKKTPMKQQVTKTNQVKKTPIVLQVVKASQAKKPRPRSKRYKCYVDGCPLNLSVKRRRRCGYSEDIQFFKFPGDPERCKTWIQLLDMEDSIVSRKRPLKTLHKSTFRVCELHFLYRDISGRRLNSRALPDKGITRHIPMANSKRTTGNQSDSDDSDDIPETNIDYVIPEASIDSIIDNIPETTIDSAIDNIHRTSHSNISNVADVSDSDGMSSSCDDDYGDAYEDDYGDAYEDDYDWEMSDIHTTSINANTTPSGDATFNANITPSGNATFNDSINSNAPHRTTDASTSAPSQVMLLKASVSKTGLLDVPGLKDNLQVVGGNYPLSAIQSGNLVLALPCKINKDNPQVSASAAGATMCIPPLQPEINSINAILPSCSLSVSSLLQTREVPSRKKLKVIGRTTGPGGRSALIATADDGDLAAVGSKQKNTEGGYTVIPPGTVIPIKMSQPSVMPSARPMPSAHPRPSAHPIPSTQPVQYTLPDSSSQARVPLKKPNPRKESDSSASKYIDILETDVDSLKAELKVVRKERKDLKQRVHRMEDARATRDDSWRKKILAEQDKWKEEAEELKSQVKKLAQALGQAKEKRIIHKDQIDMITDNPSEILNLINQGVEFRLQDL